MRLFCTPGSPVVERDNRWYPVPSQTWDTLVNRDDLHAFLTLATAAQAPLPTPPAAADLLAPIGSQEVWAARRQGTGCGRNGKNRSARYHERRHGR